jgi:segregation and condensation protein B
MSQAPDIQPQSSRVEGISLDELSEAFAQVMGVDRGFAGEGQDLPTEPGAEEAVTAVDPGNEHDAAETAPEAAAQEEDTCEVGPRTILEAMLFVGNQDGGPLTAKRAAELMRGVEPEEIPALVDQLNGRYAAHGCPYHVLNDGGGYRLVLRREFHPLRNRFYGRIREARLSQAAIDVLSIVAYQQPLTGEQIHRLRGKPSGHVLAQLVRRGLLRIERMQTKRRTAQYFTTDRFLKLFGLKGLEDLPHSEDLQ